MSRPGSQGKTLVEQMVGRSALGLHSPAFWVVSLSPQVHKTGTTKLIGKKLGCVFCLLLLFGLFACLVDWF